MDSISPIVFLLAVLYVSAVAGSFMNVLVYRLPRMLFPYELGLDPEFTDTLSRPSRCPHCDHRIRWRHNVPMLGWFILRGRCHDCMAPIPWRYPAVEIGVAAGSTLIGWYFGPSAQALAMIAVFWVLVAAALIDWDTFFLPDVLTQPLLWGGILFALYLPGDVDVKEAIEAAVAGYTLPWAVNHYTRFRTGQDGIAPGDFKLMAALGAWFGMLAMPCIVLLAVGFQQISRLLLRGNVTQEAIAGLPAGAAPLGPGLAFAGVTMIFYAPTLRTYMAYMLHL